MKLLTIVSLLSISSKAWAFGSNCDVLSESETSVCYPNMPCFVNTPPWGGTEERPSSQLPDCPENVDVHFYLDTRYAFGVEFSYNDDLTTVLTSTNGFDPTHQTHFIVHGYLDNGDTQWMIDMSNNFLTKTATLSVVGWFDASLQVNYMSSAIDTETVGGELSFLAANMIQEVSVPESNLHCIGHSLGAHVCGYMGMWLQNNGYIMGRISGLDPAGPYYQGTPNQVKLDATDAVFVDIIHTDAENLIQFGYGTSENCGHLDFWPNNGVEQPGCDQNVITSIHGGDGIYEGSRDFVACNHLRAYKFYSDSIVPKSCNFYSYPCANYDDYLDGQCITCGSSECAQMGYYANQFVQPSPTIDETYLQTYTEAPFCEFMTDVSIQFSSGTDDVDATLQLSLYGSGSPSEQQAMDSGNEYLVRPDAFFQSIIQYTSYPGQLQYVKFLWTKEEVTVTTQHLKVTYIDVYTAQEDTTMRFCLQDPSTKMSKDTRYSFYPNYCQ